MPREAHIPKFRIFQNAGCNPIARIVALDGSAIQQADITGIALSIWKDTDDTVVANAVSIDKTVVIYDTLQTDARWTKDETGYNFFHSLAASYFASGGEHYHVEYWFTPASGEVFLGYVASVHTHPTGIT